MKISRDDVLKVAALAYLELTDAEVETYRRQLDSILTYVDKLNELDTSQIEPMAQTLDAAAGQGTPLRDDVVIPCDIKDQALAAAPDPAPPYFRVPKVIDR
ncbi:MAG: Asp-tRNA(Asn)/Glu-tRNA(Gln) amidotransferase subunit GatC [Candidatus Acidiferrales bacterium]|jgi:aspartyl-tRNA(Asn)/glutamyl-tRNA(Gln) amidotransferase subunit C